LRVFRSLYGNIGLFASFFLVAFLVVDFFVIASYFLAAPLGLSLFFGTSDGVAYAARYSILYVLIFMVPLQIPAAVNIGGLFVALMTIYTSCLVASCFLEPTLTRTVRETVLISPLRIFRNWILAMPLASSMLLLAIVVLQSFQEAHGVPTGGLTFTNPFETLAELAYSPLLEEIGFRITPIGALLSLEVIIISRIGRHAAYRINLPKALILSFLVPERARRIAGLKTVEDHGILRGIGLPGWIAVLATSSAFGFAHYLSGSGWEVGKISSAFVAGLGLSLVYWRYGAHAATLLHWFFNYYSYVFQQASDTYAIAFSSLLYVLDGVTFWLGVLGWLALLGLLLLKIRGKTRESSRPSSNLFEQSTRIPLSNLTIQNSSDSLMG